uniref:Erythromycin esterase n=1 Tax=Ditylenchus dipsaci TaxID=166011 RepID=A0A915E2N2_9BILA
MNLMPSVIYLGNGEEFFDAAQNARVVASAERYYRIMYHGGPESWNLRDAHMFETLQHLLTTHGPEAKAIVWAHNSHIGDARFTDMGMKREELSLGQLCRQYYGDKAALIGFGTHTGTVAAADEWDGVMKVKPVNPSLNYSIERMCHETGLPSFLLDLRLERHPQLKEYLMEPWLERFIGVIYKPATELWSHYSKCLLAGQFDAYVV